MNSAFVRDLAYGQGFESIILEWAKIKYPNAILIEGSFKDYDIDASPSLLECKFDYKSRKTPNIVIEFEDRGKPSGIAVTKATHWIHCFWYNDWVVATASIEIWKEIIKEVDVVGGGDELSTLMYRVPKDLILRNESVSIIPLSRISVRCTTGS